MFSKRWFEIRALPKEFWCSTCFSLPQIDIHRVSAARGQQSEAYGFSARLQWQASKVRSPMKLLELCGEARTHRTSEPKVSVCNLKNAKNLQSKSVTYFFLFVHRPFFFRQPSRITHGIWVAGPRHVIWCLENWNPKVFGKGWNVLKYSTVRSRFTWTQGIWNAALKEVYEICVHFPEKLFSEHSLSRSSS